LSVITSLQNPRIKTLVALREHRARNRAGLFLVEGYEELSLALASGAQSRELYYCPALFRDTAQVRLLDQVRNAASHGELIEVSERVFEKIAYRDNPDGWLATFPLPRHSLADLHLSVNPFVIIAEAVEKPGNLGAILRTADAAGVDALISCDPLTDWGNPNVVRASKGALFTVQTAESTTAETIQWLRQQGIQIVAATLQAAVRYDRADLRAPVAITVGTEKHGLSRDWLDQADLTVSIPMFGRVNSLNVATATAILIYEVVRQRSTK